MEPLETCLGIPPDRQPPDHQPPDHYRLLGLSLFESQLEVIRAAIANARQQVAAANFDQHACAELSRQIDDAAAILTQAPAKLAYDTWLHDQLWSNKSEEGSNEVEPKSMERTPPTRTQRLEESTDWYLRHGDGVTFGPFAFTQLLHAARIDRIASDTVICHREQTSGKWIRANSLASIRSAIANKPTPTTTPMPQNIASSASSSRDDGPKTNSRRLESSRRKALFTAIALFAACCVTVAWLSSRDGRNLSSSGITAEASEHHASVNRNRPPSVEQKSQEQFLAGHQSSSRQRAKADVGPGPSDAINPTAGTEHAPSELSADEATTRARRDVERNQAIVEVEDSRVEHVSSARMPDSNRTSRPLASLDSNVGKSANVQEPRIADSESSLPRQSDTAADANATVHDPGSADTVTTGETPTADPSASEMNAHGKSEKESPFRFDDEIESTVYASVWHRALATFPLAADVSVELPSGRKIRIGKAFRQPQSEMREQLTEMLDRCDANLIRLDYDDPDRPALLISRRGNDLHGPLMSVSEEGSPRALANYRRGKRDGIVMAWDEAGRPSVWEQYVAGKRHGLRCLLKACSPDCKEGHPWMVQEWERGELVASHMVMPTGDVVTVIPPGNQTANQKNAPLAGNLGTSSAATTSAVVNDQYSSALAELYRFNSRLTSDEEQLRERVADYHLQLRRTLSSQSRARLAASRYRSLPLGPTSPYHLTNNLVGFSAVRSFANL